MYKVAEICRIPINVAEKWSDIAIKTWNALQNEQIRVARLVDVLTWLGRLVIAARALLASLEVAVNKVRSLLFLCDMFMDICIHSNPEMYTGGFSIRAHGLTSGKRL